MNDNDNFMLKDVPCLIEGGTFVDDRGVLKFANVFNFFGIKRFYHVKNIGDRMIRAWHGHENEGKVFYVVSGTFLVGVVNMKTHKLDKYTLSDYGNPKLLWVPPGHANGFMNITTENNLLIFSTSTVEESSDDDIRFNFDMWDIWKEKYR